MTTLTSRDNPRFKHLVKLAGSARQRKKDRQTLLDGAHLVAAYFAAAGMPERVVVSESGLQQAEIKSLLAAFETMPGGSKKGVTHLSDALFNEISPVKTPGGILAQIVIPPAQAMPARSGFSVLLEAIQDPGNLGSILRSAAAAGAGAVYLSADCADAWSPKTLRAAMGAHFLLPIYEQADLIAVAQSFDGQVIATALAARQSLYASKLPGNIAFVFGNEGEGLSEALLQAATLQVTIPMPGGMESLNAAAAAAVCFFEKVRQDAMAEEHL